MGILDEAIREHLDLKRQHGADDSELKQLEDEAFGPGDRPGDEAAQPDPLSEAPTEFMAQPGTPGEEAPAEETSLRQEAAARIGDLQEPPEPPEEAAAEEPAEEAEPAAEEQSAAEHEAIPDTRAYSPADEAVAAEAAERPVADEPEEALEPSTSGPSTEEREAISEQPTEMYDVEAELGGAAPQPQAPAEPEEELLEEEEDDDFWDEKRLSDELDQALEAPLDSEEEPDEEDEGTPADEGEEDDVQASTARDEDVLEETPDFLEESPEDDELWFEQKPPKDFDFDD